MQITSATSILDQYRRDVLTQGSVFPRWTTLNGSEGGPGRGSGMVAVGDAFFAYGGTIVGDCGIDVSEKAYLWTIDDMVWREFPAMSKLGDTTFGRQYSAVASHRDRFVLIHGGYRTAGTDYDPILTLEMVDIATGTTRVLASEAAHQMPPGTSVVVGPIAHHSLAVFEDGVEVVVMVFGGRKLGAISNKVYRLVLDSLTFEVREWWEEVVPYTSAAPAGRVDAAIWLLSGEVLIVVGGGTETFSTGEVWVLGGGEWEQLELEDGWEDMQWSYELAWTWIVPGQRVLVTGGTSVATGFATNRTMLIDVDTSRSKFRWAVLEGNASDAGVRFLENGYMPPVNQHVLGSFVHSQTGDLVVLQAGGSDGSFRLVDVVEQTYLFTGTFPEVLDSMRMVVPEPEFWTESPVAAVNGSAPPPLVFNSLFTVAMNSNELTPFWIRENHQVVLCYGGAATDTEIITDVFALHLPNKLGQPSAWAPLHVLDTGVFPVGARSTVSGVVDLPEGRTAVAIVAGVQTQGADPALARLLVIHANASVEWRETQLSLASQGLDFVASMTATFERRYLLVFGAPEQPSFPVTDRIYLLDTHQTIWSWTSITSNGSSPLPAYQMSMTALPFNNRYLFAMGGRNASSTFSDPYSGLWSADLSLLLSEQVVQWRLVDEDAMFPPRSGGVIFERDGLLVYLGGSSFLSKQEQLVTAGLLAENPNQDAIDVFWVDNSLSPTIDSFDWENGAVAPVSFGLHSSSVLVYGGLGCGDRLRSQVSVGYMRPNVLQVGAGRSLQRVVSTTIGPGDIIQGMDGVNFVLDQPLVVSQPNIQLQTMAIQCTMTVSQPCLVYSGCRVPCAARLAIDTVQITGQRFPETMLSSSAPLVAALACGQIMLLNSTILDGVSAFTLSPEFIAQKRPPVIWMRYGTVALANSTVSTTVAVDAFGGLGYGGIVHMGTPSYLDLASANLSGICLEIGDQGTYVTPFYGPTSLLTLQMGRLTISVGSELRDGIASVGGGVYAESNSKIAFLNGGRIRNCSAILFGPYSEEYGGRGGGVYLADGETEIQAFKALNLNSGPVLVDNHADVAGGAAFAFNLEALILGQLAEQGFTRFASPTDATDNSNRALIYGDRVASPPVYIAFPASPTNFTILDRVYATTVSGERLSSDIGVVLIDGFASIVRNGAPQTTIQLSEASSSPFGSCRFEGLAATFSATDQVLRFPDGDIVGIPGTSICQVTARSQGSTPLYDLILSPLNRLVIAVSPCIVGTESSTLSASTSVARCQPCNPRSYSLDGSVCDPCPDGANCNGGANVSNLPGYFGTIVSSQSALEFTVCPPGRCSVSAIGLSQTTDNKPLWTQQCPQGRQGLLCGSCVPGRSAGK